VTKCSSLRLFELVAKFESLTAVCLLSGFLKPSPVAGAIGAKNRRENAGV
jgi:hypothetical protein